MRYEVASKAESRAYGCASEYAWTEVQGGDGLVDIVKLAAEQTGVTIELEKVEDMSRIVGYGVMGTPGLVIDDKVVHAGSLPDPKKVAGWLQEI